MKRLIFITSILLGSLALSAQNQINAYQYWFNDDFDVATTTTLTPGETVNLQTDIDASHLTPGVHIFYLRFKDDNGLWSSPVAQFIYRISTQGAGATNEITEYQYWFDDDFDGAINQTVTASQNYQMLTDIDATSLASGVHIFYIRYKDNRGQWSSPTAQFFYKFSEQVSVQNNGNTRYQYWFDDAYDEAVSQTIPSTSNFQLLSDIDATALSSGVHIFYLRFQDERGQWSSPVAQFFYKMAEDQGGLASNDIVAYQYWFDDTYDQAITEPVTGTQNLMLATDIDATNLNPGVHIFYMRFLDSRGQWSSTVSQFIYKVQETLTMNNEITAYRYWFDDDFSSAVINPVIPSQAFFSLQEQIDMTQMWKGEYTLHYQFKDTLGMWSSPTVDTIEKISLPIAEFTYNRIENCDSTIINFQNASIDGDSCFWDFGDGAISSDSAASHVYYETGNYLVSLTVTDTSTNADSTITELIHVIGTTNSTINEEVCDAYQAPSGAILTESGIHYDTIPNYMLCDSIIEINLTVLESTYAEMNVHACDSFIAPSGQVWYSSGVFFDTIPNGVGCDSIIEISLDLGTTTYASIDEDACDVYLSPAGHLYTESGVYYDTIMNESMCDSIIEITLNIRESTYINLTEVVCDVYASPAGNLYTESGVYFDTIPNAALCDSVIEIDLTVLESTFSEQDIHACDSFMMPSGQIVYNSGIYYDTVTNTVGCDSIMTFDLSITVVDTSVVHADTSLMANQDVADYQWLNCDNDMFPVDGAVLQSFSPDETGNYAVQITLNGCVDTSACHNIIVQNIEDLFNDGFRIYPNPAHKNVYIDILHASVELIVYDITGQIVLEDMKFTGGLVDVSGFAPGIYLVEVRSKSFSGVKKLVIK